jgi:hypothetical protein
MALALVEAEFFSDDEHFLAMTGTFLAAVQSNHWLVGLPD